MSKWQIILLTAMAIVLLTVMLVTWGSVGSVLMAMCLLAMGGALLFRRFVLERDDDDFRMEL